jgi:hypothetical protein
LEWAKRLEPPSLCSLLAQGYGQLILCCSATSRAASCGFCRDQVIAWGCAACSGTGS